ncbi:hypothetical protein Cantr_07484 [Candida viswanathii]|uniref:Uncharacterized protein n=1 Tax=Candida viswanathii TaxID=5486 RepID=A0A367Y017_9ASCO|nr:hypothetical protein Cantr_07484 [Candida viswanathii]
MRRKTSIQGAVSRLRELHGVVLIGLFDNIARMHLCFSRIFSLPSPSAKLWVKDMHLGASVESRGAWALTEGFQYGTGRGRKTLVIGRLRTSSTTANTWLHSIVMVKEKSSHQSHMELSRHRSFLGNYQPTKDAIANEWRLACYVGATSPNIWWFCGGTMLSQLNHRSPPFICWYNLRASSLFALQQSSGAVVVKLFEFSTPAPDSIEDDGAYSRFFLSINWAAVQNRQGSNLRDSGVHYWQVAGVL